jgi:hypothetical protein
MQRQNPAEFPAWMRVFEEYLNGLSHEIDFKNFDKKLQNLAYLRDAAGF